MTKLYNLPKHVGIILDGNGRWAIKRHLPRTEGHKKAISTIENLVIYSKKIGIKTLTLYAFSTENWKRPKEEVNIIFKLINDYILSKADKFKEDDIKVNILGDLSKLDNETITNINNLVEKTKNCNSLILNICLNYGARNEIVNAVNKILSEKIEKIDENTFKKYLYTKDQSDPDYIIRTSGEHRLSNFLLYQSAYSEFYFPKTLLPDFTPKKFYKALKIYQKRKRRFGAV